MAFFSMAVILPWYPSVPMSEFDEDTETPAPQPQEATRAQLDAADLRELIDQQQRQGLRISEVERNIDELRGDIRELRDIVRAPAEAMNKLYFYLAAWVNEATERWFKKSGTLAGKTRPTTKPPR